MFNIHEYVEQLNVENGESRRLNCPLCKSYKTFSVTNNMGSLLWNCYKASCSIRGSARIRLSVDDIRSIQQKNELNQQDTFSLPEYVVSHVGRNEVTNWCNQWEIDPNALDLYYDVKEHRVVFPIKSKGRIVDATGRSILHKRPKWKRYGKSDLPFSFGCGSIAIVVEDCISAGVVGSDVYVGVAVLGTSLSDSHKQFLSQFSTTIIALDPDALPKTLSFAKELRSYIKDVRILNLKDDIKYRRKEDILKLKQLTQKETQLWN